MKTNLITAAVCFSVVLYHYTVHAEIISHPYMQGLIFLLLGIGGYNAGVGLAKFYRDYID